MTVEPSPDRRREGLGVDLLVVDGANVVGSRPDGWWKDRAGAASRLHAKLVATTSLAPEVVLVLEGRARSGVAPIDSPPVRVVHAPGDGDDEIVAQVQQAGAGFRDVAVVTADRGLSARAACLGARVLRPGWLWNRLDASDPSSTGP